MRRLFLLALPAILLVACDSGDPISEASTPDASTVAAAPRTSTPSNEERAGELREVSVAAWAAHVCAAGETLLTDLEAANDGVDPTTLPLEERRERAIRIDGMLVADFERFSSSMGEVEAPDDAAGLYESLEQMGEDVAAAIRNAQPDLEQAASAAEIEAVNAEVNIVLERTFQDIDAAGAAVPADVAAALRGVSHCRLLTE